MRALTCLALGLSACWLPAETGALMQAELRTLETDLQQTKKTLDTQSAVLEEERQRLGEQMQRADVQVNKMGQALDELNRAARDSSAETALKLERLIKEFQELRGAVELNDYRLKNVETHFEGEQGLPLRLSTVEAKLSTKAGAAATERDAPAAPAAGIPEATSKQEMLAQARELTAKGKVVDARGVYREILRRWPEELGVADVARFQLGELYFGEQKYRGALEEYIKVAEQFKKGSLEGDAYYRIGLCSIHLGDLNDASIFLNEVVTKHRTSRYFKEASEKLKEVRGKLSAEKRK